MVGDHRSGFKSQVPGRFNQLTSQKRKETMAYTRLEVRGKSTGDDTYSLVIEGDVNEVIEDYLKIQQSDVFVDSDDE